MDYSMSSPSYIPVVPRILPSQSQHSSKKFAMIDDGYQYMDNHHHHHPSSSPYVSPTNQSFSPRTQPNSNRIYSTYQDKGRLKNGLYHQPLKDNSIGDSYPTHYFDHLQKNSSSSSPNHFLQCPKIFFILFAILIGLFSLTALIISIYVLVKLSSITF